MSQRIRATGNEHTDKAVEELLAYRDIKHDIRHARRKAEEYRDRYTYLQSPRYDAIRVQGGDQFDKMCLIVMQWADLEIQAQKREHDLERTEWAIRAKLEQIGSDYADVLELFYIKAYPIAKIAQLLNYSERQIITKKRQALERYANL